MKTWKVTKQQIEIHREYMCSVWYHFLYLQIVNYIKMDSTTKSAFVSLVSKLTEKNYDEWRYMKKQRTDQWILCKTKKSEEKENIWIYDLPFQQEAFLLHKGGHIVSFSGVYRLVWWREKLKLVSNEIIHDQWDNVPRS